jgi:dipeptidase D
MSRFVSPSRFVVASLLAGLASVASACAASDDSESAGADLSSGGACDETCVYKTFLEFAKVFRPSGKEEKARLWVEGKLKDAIASGVWDASEVSFDHDAAGNEVIRLPGTGGFEHKQPVAIQSHLDMVLAVSTAAPGQALEPFFQNGVDVVEEGDIVHSRDFKTTLGSDDGFGVAQQVRYIVDRSLPHPPLELVFTTGEEVGMTGGVAYDTAKLPLHAKLFISLDSNSSDDVSSTPNLSLPLGITIGANGGIQSNMSSTLPAVAPSSTAPVLKIALDGLAGGHSGGNIELKRMSSIRAFAGIVDHLVSMGVSPQIVDVQVGDLVALTGANKIPTSFVATVALADGTDVAATTAAIQQFFAEFAAPFTDEVQANIKLGISQVPASQSTALDAGLTAQLSQLLSSVPNGVLKPNPEFPLGVETSSNMGLLGVTPAKTGTDKAFFLSALPRAYVLETAQSTLDTITTDVRGLLSSVGRDMTAQNAPLLPWQIPGDAKAVTVARKGSGDLVKKIIRLPGATEGGLFAQKFPHLANATIGIGWNGADWHTVKERASKKSFLDATTVLQRVLVAFGNDADLLK